MTETNERKDQNTLKFSWGEVTWLITRQSMPNAEHAFGVSVIKPGMSNPLHIHPNCEEVMYIISGKCECKVDDAVIMLNAGEVIRIPRGVVHNARCIGEEPVHAVISFPTLDRKTIAVDDSEELA